MELIRLTACADDRVEAGAQRQKISDDTLFLIFFKISDLYFAFSRLTNSC